MTYEPGLAIHSTPVEAFLKNLFACAPGFVRCLASRSSNGNIATMPTVNAPATKKSFFVNSGAGVLALSALALGGSAGCPTTSRAAQRIKQMAVDNLVNSRRTDTRITAPPQGCGCWPWSKRMLPWPPLGPGRQRESGANRPMSYLGSTELNREPALHLRDRHRSKCQMPLLHSPELRASV